MCTPQRSHRHHFLPVFYLRQWCDSASRQPGGAPGVWKINRDGSGARRYSPRNQVFWIDDANTLTSTAGTQTDLPERILGRVESVVAATIRDRIARHEPLNRDESDAIRMFFSSLSFRVPSARAALQAGIDAQARIERETAVANGQPEPDTALFQQNALAHMASISMTAILPELERMTHRVLLAPAGEFFLTCDRPAQIWAPIGFPGIANQLCEATLPLSPTALLFLTWHGVERSGYCEISAADVLAFNRRMIASSHQWFISPQRSTNPLWF